MLNREEQQFIDRINEKILKYDIPTSLKECLEHSTDNFIETTYTNGTTEVVNIGIEWYLCSISPYYFIDKYAWIDFPGKGIVPFTLYYFQKETLKVAPETKKMVFLKTRQCLTEDNYVMTDRGYVSIKDVKIGDKIETIIDEKPTFTLVEDFIEQEEKEVCRILTNSGAEIKSTLDHKILTRKGWKEAKDITLQDEIVSLINKGSFGDFKLKYNEQSALIGYYLADGKSKQPYFVNTNKSYINEVIEAGKLFENCDPYIYKRKKVKNNLQSYEARLVSKTKSNKLYRPIKEFFNKFNLNKKSINRDLTNDLINLNKKQMSILINRLFAGDGWITYQKDKRRVNYIQYEIGLGSPCHSLIKQVEYILQTKYGIHCWVNKSPFNGNDFWKLRITQKKSVIKFINEIGIKDKTDKKEIQDLIANEKPYSSNQSFEKIRKIERLKDKEKVYDITTFSGNFLTNGLMVHNCGISTLYSLYCFWKGNFHESESIDVISTKQQKAQKFVSKMDATINRIPEFLKTSIESKNSKEIKWINNSTILSESASDRAGRGDTLSLLVLDEAAHYQTDRLTRGIIAAAMPTLGRSGGSVVLISTPNGVGGSGSYYYEQVQNLKINGNSKEEKLIEIDWWEIPDIDGVYPRKGYNQKLGEFIDKDYFNKTEVKEEATSFFKPISKRWRENPWLKKQHADLGDILFKQEVFHDFIVGEGQVFDDGILKKISNEVTQYKPIEENEINGNQLKGMLIWNYPIPKHRYIVGVDVSTGTSDDYSSIEVMDVETYEQVAEYKGKIPTKPFGKLVKKIAKYYNQAFVVIECNSIGEAVFNEVYYHDTDPYNNIYKQKKTKNGVSRFTGWETNVKTRQLMINNLIDWVVVDELFEQTKIKSSRLYAEMNTWVYKNGRVDHVDGGHDDSLIAWGLCLYLRNKATSYGESFAFIAEDGSYIEPYNQEDVESDSIADFAFGDEESINDKIKEQYGVSSLDEYKWLVG